MMRAVVVVGALLLGVGAVMAQQDIAVQQDNLMRGLAKNLYGPISKIVKGDSAYDQVVVNTAIAELEAGVAKIPVVFTPNPKENVVNSSYGSSQKIWQNKADFDSKAQPVAKAIADAKAKIKDLATLKAAYASINNSCDGCHETYRIKLK